MPRYVATALSVFVAMSPAAALDLGLGGKAGGTGAGVSVGAGTGGVSVGIGADAGGLGSAETGASVSTGEPTGAGVGTSASVGGVDVDAGASVSTDGGSTNAGVGASTSTGGVSTSAGASVASGDGSSPGGAGASTGNTNAGVASNGGGTGGGTGVSSRDGASSSSSASSPNAADGNAGSSWAERGGIFGSLFGSPADDPGPSATTVPSKPKSVRIVKRARYTIVLPRSIKPTGGRDRAAAMAPFDSIPGTPRYVVRACRDAIRSAAMPLGMVSVHAISAGTPSSRQKGALTAPIEVRIRYETQRGIEIKQARVKCHLNTAGQVVSVT